MILCSEVSSRSIDSLRGEVCVFKCRCLRVEGSASAIKTGALGKSITLRLNAGLDGSVRLCARLVLRIAISRGDAKTRQDAKQFSRVYPLLQAFSFFLASGYASARSSVSWLNSVISLYIFWALTPSPLFS